MNDHYFIDIFGLRAKVEQLREAYKKECIGCSFEEWLANRITELEVSLTELEVNQCNDWHTRLSDEGLINYGETPVEGVASIFALIDGDHNG